jgi:hypothetical protein
MFSGTMIDDLIRMVERTEEHARTETVAPGAAAAAADVPVLQVEVYPEFSTFVYQWQGMEQVIGVA